MIPFNKPYISETLQSDVFNWLGRSVFDAEGESTVMAESIVANLVGGGKTLLTSSCTSALDMISLMLDFKAGDEVIMPSFTFTSAATAIVNTGATPIFVDVELDSKNISIDEIENAISNRTRAISYVNYGGISPDIERLRGLAKSASLVLIEDNAHGLGASHKSNKLGSIGDFATQSFHLTKNIHCFEGGALILNNNLFESGFAYSTRQKGTNRRDFIDGIVEKYEWKYKGISAILAELLASVLLSNLLKFEEVQLCRMSVWERYFTELQPWAIKNGVELMYVPNDAKHSAHLFYLMFDQKSRRLKFQDFLASEGISTATHYQPLHLSSAGQKFGRVRHSLPNSSYISENLVRLPLWYGITSVQIDKIIDRIKAFK